jgi:YD repeat-containing protein
VTATCDARGTRTTFTYDAAGRWLTRVYAAGTTLAVAERTCYDKVGCTLWRIGAWTFNPTGHGADNDTDMISTMTYDLASCQVAMSNPAGNVTQIVYRKDGQVVSVTDSLSVQTVYCCDKARRQTIVAQGYQAQDGDPALWA